MRAIKFCEILMTCVLALLFTCHAAWAVKLDRPPPGHRETFPGHAVLADGLSISSDTGNPYLDTEFGGDDHINFTTDKATEAQLLRLTFKIVPYSLRRVRFDFDIDGAEVSMDTEAALLYSLLLSVPTFPPESLVSRVRMGVWYRLGAEDPFEVAFIVDGITREVVELAGVNTELYRFSVGEDKDRGTADDHLTYHLRYDSELKIDEVVNGWTIEPQSSDGVTLCDQRLVEVEEPIGNSGNTRLSWQREDIDLATYTAVPFRLTVIAGPPPPPAPRRHKTLSTLWGEIKAK